MQKAIIVLSVAIAAVTVLSAFGKNWIASTKKALKPIRATIPLTLNEQPMFFRLTEAFPSHVILAQVAFSALLDTKDRAVRNRFDRKRADFVICTKAFEVVAVIELDDSSHRGRNEQDGSRDKLLTDAGYKVFRYKRVPDIALLQKDIGPTDNAKKTA